MNENKDLLLKYLCMALPYRVMLSTPNGNKPLLALVFSKKYNAIVEYNDYHGNENDVSEWDGGDVEFIKPYLRPMSSMTEEEKKKYNKLCIASYHRAEPGLTYEGWWSHYNTPQSLDYLNSIHIDYRGLIEKKLAIEVTESNNPYKE